jgi:hypothetical protein
MQTGGTVNSMIEQKEHLTTNMKYRSYLQRNALSSQTYNLAIAQAETAALLQNNSHDYITGPPHMFLTCGQPQTPKYQTSDLKEWYFKTMHA